MVPFLRRFVLEVVGPEAEHEADRRLLQWWDRQVGRAHPGSLPPGGVVVEGGTSSGFLWHLSEF